jgi:uncharacterized protein YndB with AHSA1/START domain
MPSNLTLNRRRRTRALVIHNDEAGRKQHEEMGFHEGWGKALDQLVAYVKTLSLGETSATRGP